MFTKVFTALLAVSASAMAYTTPTTFNVTSNPIYTPGLGALVPVGQPYQVTWGPTEKGTVSIVLLRGPSNNVQPLYSIADKIANTGSFFWTPKASLEPDTTHYGLQIIIDSNGQFQYSPQFGISNPNYSTKSVTSGAATSTDKATSTYAATSAEETTTSVEVVTHTTKSQVTSFITLTTSSAVVSSYVAPTYTAPAGNGTTTAVYVPSSTAAPSVTTGSPPAPSQTGAASSLKVASGLVFGVVGVAAMLL